MLIIGIAGPARSGKDTLCQFLLKTYGQAGARYAFADPMKEAIKKAFCLDEQHVNGNLKETPIPELGSKSPRYILQTFGTDYAREYITAGIWLRVAERYIAALNKPVIVIPDVRFENEAEWVRQQNGVIVHLQRADAETINAHISENGIRQQPEDFVIENNGSLETLRLRAKGLVQEITEGLSWVS